MSVKGYLALLVGVFVVALAVVGVSQRATAGAVAAVLVPVAVTLAAATAEQSSGVAQTSATMEELAAGRLREVARPGDVPGRWGGEEFLVVLPGVGLAEAMALGERTRLAVAAAPVPLADQPLTVTTSVGVATGADDGWEGLVRRADTGLYAAKEGGRDRVVAGPAAGSRSFTPGGQDAARYR
jgi:hypothetical protein